MFDVKMIELIGVILINILSIFMALLVYFSGKKEPINKFFALLSGSIILWIDFGYLGGRYDLYSLVLTRLNMAVVPLCFIFFYLFTSYFTNLLTKSKLLHYLVVFSGIVFVVLAAFTGTVIESVAIDIWGTELSSGYLAQFFYAWVVILTLLIIYKLILGYIKSKLDDRPKLSLFLTGFALFAIANIIFNLLLPAVFGVTKYYKFGDYSIIFFLAFTAYAIMKRQLFNIKLIATEISVVLISIALIVEIFISNSFTEGLIIFLIWSVATYGGLELIKSVKREIKQREDLAILAKKLEKANDDLKKMDELKDDFISMASHELNTPVSAIKGYMSMILDEGIGGKIPDMVRGYLEKVYSSSQRLASMIKDLLNVSRIESGRIHLIFEQKPIEGLIEQAIGEIMSKATEVKHTLTFKKPAKAMPPTWYDVTRIIEVLINIIGNAIKYTDPGGKIEVSVSTDDKSITVAVKDNGRGIPKNKQDNVFSKFNQVDVLKDEVRGTGLGMYISKTFIELHKGKIWFESEGEGKGTTFFFSLPILKDKPADPHEGEGAVLH